MSSEAAVTAAATHLAEMSQDGDCSIPLRLPAGMCVLSFARTMSVLALGTLLYFFPGPVIAMIYSIEGDHESSVRGLRC